MELWGRIHKQSEGNVSGQGVGAKSDIVKFSDKSTICTFIIVPHYLFISIFSYLVIYLIYLVLTEIEWLSQTISVVFGT